jgi:hypothetical protein
LLLPEQREQQEEQEQEQQQEQGKSPITEYQEELTT